MRALLQRAAWGRVIIRDETVGEIGPGLVILLGVGRGDTEAHAEFLAKKAMGLRIFEDDDGKMNLSLGDIGGAVLVVSQFTLHADCRKGRRPFFGNAEEPERATQLCDHFAAALQQEGATVKTGQFGASMRVELCNDGPVTIMLDTDELEKPRRG